jgi:S-adenosylmethionine hydrolase
MHRLDMEWLKQQDWLPLSSTFHGRDIFAPLAASFASGSTSVADIGPVVDELVPCLLEEPVRTGQNIQGTVIAIDHFGNLITNIDQRLLESFHTPEAHAAGKRFSFHCTYGQRKPGEFMALINSFGVVEISRVESSAADSLGLGRGAPVLLKESG